MSSCSFIYLLFISFNYSKTILFSKEHDNLTDESGTVFIAENLTSKYNIRPIRCYNVKKFDIKLNAPK